MGLELHNLPFAQMLRRNMEKVWLASCAGEIPR